MIVGKDADTFFGQLAEKVASLADVSAQHPVATPVAVATLKRYLAEDRYRIQLADFVLEEVRSAVSAISRHPGHFYKNVYDDETIGFIAACDVQFDRLLRLLITGSFWGTRSQGKLWTQAVEHVARSATPGFERPRKSGIAVYPAILLFYGCGIASLAGKRYSTIARLLTTGRFKNHLLTMPIMVESLRPR